LDLTDLLRGVLDRVGPHRSDTPSEADVRLAMVVLLLEVAQRDGNFSAVERKTIKRLLSDRFQLVAEDRDALLESAAAMSAGLVQLHPYTSSIAQLPLNQRVALIEMLWEVAYADGNLDPEEEAMVRLVGNLIHIDDRDRVLARMRVHERLSQPDQQS
jgi:uncharacterized tellurite resistance protein B-like protein